MAGQERDDAEPTEGVTGEPGGRAGGDASHADQPSSSDPAPPDEPSADRSEPQPGELPESTPEAAALGPDGTSVLPPVAGAPPSTPERPRWSARAQVPTPRVEDYSEEWVTEAPRSVLFPVLVTAVVVLLLVVAGLGVWLVLSNRPGPTPTESGPTEPPVTTSSTTTAPTTTTTSATPTGILVPELIGREYADAAQELGGLGLEPQREDVFHDTIPPGQVVATSPTAGSRLAPGDTITVYVSLGPEPTESPSASPTESETGSETGGVRDNDGAPSRSR